jgi:hypothetical protein
MSYTKGKWLFRKDDDAVKYFNDYLINVSNRQPLIARIFDSKSKTDFAIEARANAQRICQCVNGWDELQAQNKGLLERANRAEAVLVKFEHLAGEEMQGFNAIQARNKELKQERDDLLAACKALFLRVTMHYVNHQEICKLGEECPDKKALKLAEAAIAKADKQGT